MELVNIHSANSEATIIFLSAVTTGFARILDHPCFQCYVYQYLQFCICQTGHYFPGMKHLLPSVLVSSSFSAFFVLDLFNWAFNPAACSLPEIWSFQWDWSDVIDKAT